MSRGSPVSHSKESNKKVLITQQATVGLRNTYARLTKNYGVHVDFQVLVKAKPIPLPFFRTYKPVIKNATAILFSNKLAMDLFFQLSKESGIEMLSKTKYFFATEALQPYLTKFTELKKRKVYHGRKQLEDLFPILKNHKKERFLFPCSNLGRPTLKAFFDEKKFHYTEMPIYTNIFCKMTDLNPAQYAVVVFFTPFAVRSFVKSFPDYNWENTSIAAFGEKTIQEIRTLGWKVAIMAPSPSCPSILNGLEQFFEGNNTLPLAKPTSAI